MIKYQVEYKIVYSPTSHTETLVFLATIKCLESDLQTGTFIFCDNKVCIGRHLEGAITQRTSAKHFDALEDAQMWVATIRGEIERLHNKYVKMKEDEPSGGAVKVYVVE